MLISLLLSLAVGQGFADTDQEDLERRLIIQRSMFPQEKVHVMTDRELYQPGDTVWLRAWVVDGESLKPRARGSRYVYAELRDGMNHLHTFAKIKENEGRFIGQLIIPKSLASGDYTFIAYTYYNLSTHEDFLFKKIIHLISEKDAKKGYTARALYEGYKPEASKLEADPLRPYSFYRRDTLTRVTFEAPDSTWLAISLTDDKLTPSDTSVTISRMLPNVPDIFSLEVIAQDSVFYKPQFKFERFQLISGQVKDNPKNTINTITLLNLTKPQILTTKTDEEGNFSFIGIDSPDSTLWAVMGKMPDGSKISDMILSNYLLPATIHHLPSNAKLYYLNTNREKLKDQQNKSNALEYDDSPLASLQDTVSVQRDVVSQKRHGMDLEELHLQSEESQDTVKQEDIKQDKEIKQILQTKYLDDIYTRLADETKFTDNVMLYVYSSISEMVSKFDGIYFDGGVAMYKEEGYDAAPVRFVYNTTEIPIEVDENGNYKPQMILQYPVDIVYAVDFLNPDKASAIGHTDYPNSPIVRIDVKKPNELVYLSGSNRYFKIQMPLGYQKRFYFPNYKVIHKPLSTRFWNPEVYTGTNGKVTLELPIPSDYHTTYTLRAEGMTPQGEPVSIIYRIEK